MSRPLSRLSILAGSLLLAGTLPALAQSTPRSVNDCERLKNDLAYNQCLSMFGPAAKNVAGGFAAADSAGASAGAPATAIPQAESIVETPRTGRSYRGRHGRQRAVFTSGSSSRSYRSRRRR